MLNQPRGSPACWMGLWLNMNQLSKGLSSEKLFRNIRLVFLLELGVYLRNRFP